MGYIVAAAVPNTVEDSSVPGGGETASRRKRHRFSLWRFHTYLHHGIGGVFFAREEASFGGNNWLYDAEGTGAIQGRPISWNWKHKDVAQPNRIPVFADTMWRGGGSCYRTSETSAPSASFNCIVPPQFDGQWIDYSNEMMHFTLNRHQTGINVLFMDWTVQSVGLKELWTLKWHRKYAVNGPWTKAGGVQASDWPEWMRNFKDY